MEYGHLLPVILATLVVVQNSVNIADLGVATSSNQFARTLGGTVGMGTRTAIRKAIAGSVSIVFWIILVAAFPCLAFCILLPRAKKPEVKT